MFIKRLLFSMHKYFAHKITKIFSHIKRKLLKLSACHSPTGFSDCSGKLREKPPSYQESIGKV